tara:strand:+ start:2160 stop:6008 length:3849 start_codon:yes stop_codon:yes gene_type:complete
MSSNVCILDNGPACEPDKLIVEIVGKQHPDTQRLLICDAEGQPLDGIIAAAEDEEVSGEGVSSLLKIWDWEEQPGETLYLEIASDSGAPIRLPLLTDLRATPRQDEAQLNQIVPVVPCTALPSIKQQDNSGIPVLVRSGYIYVFIWGKLWRELEVRFTDEGTRYFDIDVESFRNEHGFANGKRPATGVALEDIWLPSQWNGSWAGSLDLIFSEVQLSAARLKRYERHENYRNPRVSMPRLLVSESLWRQRWADAPAGLTLLEAQHGGQHNHRISPVATRYRMASNVFPVRLCAPQRQRQPGHEWLLDQPAKMLCDLTGNYPQQALESTRQATEAWRTGMTSEPPADFESEAWRTCYGGCDADAIAVWQAQDAQPDALQAVRDRQLYAVLLPDPMYRLRHLQARIDALQTLLKYCTQLAMEHPHHASALLLQNLAVPISIGGNRNPLHQSIQSKLTEDGKREINIATSAVERANTWELLASAQLALANCLKLDQSQQCVADHLSLDNFEYAAAMFFVVRVMASIASTPDQLDPLAIKDDIHNAVSGFRLHRPNSNPGQQLLTEILNRESHPLHTMLWPRLRYDELFVDFIKPPEEEPNEGDGRFRATALAHLEDMDAPDEESETLDGMTLAALMASGELQDSFTAHKRFKAGMAVLTKIGEILSSSVKAAENRAANIAHQLGSSNQTVAANRANAEQIRQDQSRLRTDLGQHVTSRVDTRLFTLTGEHLRQTMPLAYEGAHFVEAGKNSGNRRYLIGLEELPEVDRRVVEEKLFGKYLDGAGNRLATTDRRAAQGPGRRIVPETGIFFSLPVDSETTRILQELSQTANCEAAASSALLASRANSEQIGGALQRANSNVQQRQEGRAHRALNSRPFSALVLMMETWNVQVAVEEFETKASENGSLRARIGVAGAGLDLAIALEVLVSKAAGNQSILSAAGRPLVTVSQGRLESIVGMRLAAHITREVSVRLLGQIFAGLLFSGLSISDAIHSARWSDNAVWGHSITAIGGLIGAAAPLFAGSALFGPMGVIAVTLIIGGALIVARFSNTAFEDWLAGSIFSREGGFSNAERARADAMPWAGSSSRHLEDPDEALYRLVGLLTGVSIKVEDNPDFDPTMIDNGSSSEQARKKRANTRITVRSNVSGMFSELESENSIVECLLVRNEIRYQPSNHGLGYRVRRRDQPDRSTPVLQHVTSDSHVLYVNTPASTPNSHSFQNGDQYYWEVRAQFRLKDEQKNKTWVFPALPPKATPINMEQETSADFRRTNRPLWADQETHAATGANG